MALQEGLTQERRSAIVADIVRLAHFRAGPHVPLKQSFWRLVIRNVGSWPIFSRSTRRSGFGPNRAEQKLGVKK